MIEFPNIGTVAGVGCQTSQTPNCQRFVVRDRGAGDTLRVIVNYNCTLRGFVEVYTMDAMRDGSRARIQCCAAEIRREVERQILRCRERGSI